MSALAKRLDGLTVEGELYEKLANDSVRCYACGHRCLIREGKRGICQVRFNEGGKLMVPHGYVAALQSDPIEKKPFSHVLPGSNALTFGMLGCDYHCPYCQNWLTSQAMRDPASDVSAQFIREITPHGVLDYARMTNASVVVSSYNEPLITTEWAVEIFKVAKENGLMCAFDTVQCMLQRPAKLTVILIAHTFQIHFVCRKIRREIIHHFGRVIAVGNVSAHQAVFFCNLENLYCPFAGDQRLIIRRDHHRGICHPRIIQHPMRRDLADELR